MQGMSHLGKQCTCDENNCPIKDETVVKNKYTISVEAVRSSYYEQYRHEIDAIWRNSKFAWSFEAVIFGACGFLFNDVLNGSCPKTYDTFYYILNLLILIGLSTSAIWIALSKASKTWQEFYEGRIVSLEHNRTYFRLPREYAMSGTSNRCKSLDSSLLSRKSGKFSPGKINIFISQFVWVLWFGLFIFLQVVADLFILQKIKTILGFVLVYTIFLVVMKHCARNSYNREEDYKGEFIIETLVRTESVLKELENLEKPITKENLYAFVINAYCGISFALFKIFEAQKLCDSFEDWLTMPFEKAKEDFCWHYVQGNLEKAELCESFKKRFCDVLLSVKERLREFYIRRS